MKTMCPPRYHHNVFILCSYYIIPNILLLMFCRADPNVLLNKHDELVSKCRHRNKLTFKCFKDR